MGDVEGAGGITDALRTVSYGIGHFYNDLCACLWFFFLLMFAEKVLMLNSFHAGVVIGSLFGSVMLLGFEVGYFLDNLELPACFQNYGKRKSWHAAGSLLVSISFPFIFNVLISEHRSVSDLAQLAWLLPFVFAFQVLPTLFRVEDEHFRHDDVVIVRGRRDDGWGFQALIPHLAQDPSRRTTLNAIRNCFTVIAQVTVCSMMIAFLGVSHDKLSPDDRNTFRLVSLIVIAMGVVTSTLFHLGTKEGGSGSYSALRCGGVEEVRPVWKRWLTRSDFWLTAIVYMCSRLYINVTQVYMGLYVEYTQNFDKKFVAIIPLIVCLASFLISTLLSIPMVNRLFSNSKLLYLVGAVLGGVACSWLWRLGLKEGELYGIAVILGMAQALALVCSLGITADLIGSAGATCAFVYGSMSFADKLLNGIAYVIVQTLDPSCESHGSHPRCRNFFRNVVVLVPAGALAAALLAVSALFLLPRPSSRSPSHSPSETSSSDPDLTQLDYAQSQLPTVINA